MGRVGLGKCWPQVVPPQGRADPQSERLILSLGN